MNKPKLILCCNTYNEEYWVRLMLKSVIHGVDKVVIVDSGSTDKTKEVVTKVCNDNNTKLIWLDHIRKNLPSDDGEQRNVYLNYLKQYHMNDWTIVLDADEVLKGNIMVLFDDLLGNNEDKKNNYIKCIDIRMEHLIGDMGHVDDTIPEHFVRRRMFKIEPQLHYPETEHNILQGFKKENHAQLRGNITLYHFAHVRKSALYWKEKYEMMHNKSNIHTPEMQEWWYYNHLFGTFPRKKIDISVLPSIIKDEFFINYKRDKMKVLISIGTVPNNTEKLMQCINSIQKTTHQDHQILITNNDWKGFAYAHNKALQKILSDDELQGVILLNDDCRIKCFDWIDLLTKYPNSIVGTKGSKRESLVGDYLAFYCVYIPRSIIEKIGILDERFKVGDYEDLDYCLRAKNEGFQIYELQKELVEHDISHTVGDLKGELEKERAKNKGRFYAKWGLNNKGKFYTKQSLNEEH